MFMSGKTRHAKKKNLGEIEEKRIEIEEEASGGTQKTRRNERKALQNF